MNLAKLAMGPIGIAFAIAATLAPLFMDFGGDVDDLSKLQKSGISEADSQIARLRAAGDEAGAKFLEAANVIKETLGKKVEPLNPRTIDRAQEVFAKLPKGIRDKFGVGFEKNIGEARAQFANVVKQLETTGVVDVETRTALGLAMNDLKTVFALTATTNPQSEALLKTLDAQLAGLADQSQGMQNLAASMDRLTEGILAREGAPQQAAAVADAAAALTATSTPLLTGPRTAVMNRGMTDPITSDTRAALMQFVDAAVQQEQQRRNEEAAAAASLPPGPMSRAGGTPAKTGWETVAKKTDETNAILRNGPLVRLRVDDLVAANKSASASAAARGNEVE
jgi:hypothetical protein